MFIRIHSTRSAMELKGVPSEGRTGEPNPHKNDGAISFPASTDPVGGSER